MRRLFFFLLLGMAADQIWTVSLKVSGQPEGTMEVREAGGRRGGQRTREQYGAVRTALFKAQLITYARAGV